MLLPLLLRKYDFPAIAVLYRQQAAFQTDEDLKVNLFCFNVLLSIPVTIDRDSHSHVSQDLKQNMWGGPFAPRILLTPSVVRFTFFSFALIDT